MRRRSVSRRVVVIGGGIVGAVTCVELLRDGHQVTLVEPGPPGGEQSASYGNGTLLNPGSIIPVSTPGLLKKVPGYLMDPMGPLTIRWSYLARLAPWLVRFVRAGSTRAKVAAAARALRPLLADSPERHRRLAEEAGVGALIRRQGVLYPFPDRAAFEAEALTWGIRRENGITWMELEEGALRQQEPLLDRRYTFAVFMPQAGNVADPGAYVAALIAHAEALGATRIEDRATGFRIESGRLRAVQTGDAEIGCDAAVISAGAWSGALAGMVGDRVSLETERGYHAVLDAPGIELRHPMLTSDSKVAVVSTKGGLRVAGTVELAGLDAAPTWERAHKLREVMLNAIPSLPRDLPLERFRFWLGNRPSTPDGVPVIGRASACPDVVHAYGHGHVGLAGGAMTGRLAADLVSGKPATIDIGPFSPQRFN
jgi:D-amino-acid dehydrogenase